MPKLDERTREDIEAEIERLAAAYTPEWRFLRENPDVGSVLAHLFAGMMEENIRCYNEMLLEHRLNFLDLLGISPLPAKKAEGYVAFGLARNDLPEMIVEAGMDIAAEGEDKSLIHYETAEDVYVTAALVELRRQAEEERLYLRFDCLPGPGVISLLFSLEQAQEIQQTGLIWEFGKKDRWEVFQAEDQTGGFGHTGLVRFVRNPGWECSRVMGEDGYWLRVCRGRNAALLQGEISVTVNAVSARAREAGKQGNLAAGSAMKLMKSVGFITEVWNPVPFYGGTEDEARDLAVSRGSARIRHQFRAVTPRDFENLVYEKYPDMKRVACFSGYDRNGCRSPGTVTVVILPEEYEEGRHYFYKAQEETAVYLNQFVPGGLAQQGRLHVTGPVFVSVHVRCELCVRSYGEVQAAREDGEMRLRQFLEPLTGNCSGSGWELGELPEYGQIKACLLGTVHARYLKSLYISYETETEGETKEVLPEQIKNHPWVLPKGGSCRMLVTVED